MGNDVTGNTILTLGQYLSKARLASGLSVEDMAHRTNRPEKIIEALESEQWSAFSTPSLVRGILTQYAKVVGVDINEAMDMLPEKFKSHRDLESVGIKNETILVEQPSIFMRPSFLLRTGIIVLSVLVVVLLAYWIFAARFTNKSDELQKLTQPNQVQIAPQVAAEPAAPAPVALEETLVPPAAEQNVPPATTPEASAGTTVSDQGITLTFRGLVWVKVQDGTGKIVLMGDQNEGTEQNISGQPPFNLIIADGTKVDMSWKGQPYDLNALVKGKRKVVRINGLQ